MVSMATVVFIKTKHANHLNVSFVTTIWCFPISRFELPGIGGLNFVLSHSLGGGGVASLRIDPQVGGNGNKFVVASLPGSPCIVSSRKLSGAWGTRLHG